MDQLRTCWRDSARREKQEVLSVARTPPSPVPTWAWMQGLGVQGLHGPEELRRRLRPGVEQLPQLLGDVRTEDHSRQSRASGHKGHFPHRGSLLSALST